MLAGYFVGRVSGLHYDEYVQQQILDPLGMVHSTAHSLIPPHLRARASVGYTYSDGVFRPFPEYFTQPAALPSGSATARRWLPNGHTRPAAPAAANALSTPCVSPTAS